MISPNDQKPPFPRSDKLCPIFDQTSHMSNSLALRFATTMGHYLIKMWNPIENLFPWKITIQSSLGCHIGEPLLLHFRTVIRTLSFGTRCAMGIPRRRIRWGGPLRIFQNPLEEHAILKNRQQNGQWNGTGETTTKNTVIFNSWRFGSALVLARSQPVSKNSCWESRYSFL